MSTTCTQQKELRLVESVDFKILAVANDEIKLHHLLQRYLAPLIAKATSNYGTVRARVIEILARLKVFIQPPGIVLPVDALLRQYKTSDSAIVKQLDLSFIQHSLERINDDDRRQLIPIAIAGLANDVGQPGASTMVQVALRLLQDVRIPSRGSQEGESFRMAIGLSDEADTQYLIMILGVFFRLRAPTTRQTLAEINPAISAHELSLFSTIPANPLGLLNRLSESKAKMLSLLASSAFSDEEKLLPALFAASELDSRQSAAAEDIIKKSSHLWEKENVVGQLFQSHTNLPAAYRIRILNLLSKSIISASMSENVLAVVALDLPPADLEQRKYLQPSSNIERTKLQGALFHFLASFARNCSLASQGATASKLIYNLKSFIESEGWPIAIHPAQSNSISRVKAYETIGLLLRSATLSVEERVDLGRWLLKSLSEDSTVEAAVSIDGTLSSLIASLPQGVNVNYGIKSDLLKYMSLSTTATVIRSTRHACVKWANHCFPFSDLVGRWIDIIAVAGRKAEASDVIELGLKGLDPMTYSSNEKIRPPLLDWKDMMIKFFDTNFETVPAEKTDFGRSAHHEPAFRNFQGERLSAYPFTLRYCKHMMLLTALDDFEMQPDWTHALELKLRSNMCTREKVRAYLQGVRNELLVFYLRLCLLGASIEDSPIVEECLRCFVDVASLSPEMCIATLVQAASAMLRLCNSHTKEIRVLAAKAFGILGAHPANDLTILGDWARGIEPLMLNADSMIGHDAKSAEGSILALAHLASRSVYYARQLPPSFYLSVDLLQNDFRTLSVYEATMRAFTELWAAQIALPSLQNPTTFKMLVERLAAEAQKSNEGAIAALGSLAVGVPDCADGTGDDILSDGWIGLILSKLFALFETKEIEAQFAIGDAISAAIARWDSKALQLTLDVEAGFSRCRIGARENHLKATLTRLLRNCLATKASIVRASGLWLFCLVQNCSHLKQIQGRFRDIQPIFIRLLGWKDEAIQEAASRGLSFIYEQGDSELKSALSKDLVSTFTGSVVRLKVDNETELFEPGSFLIGKGDSITSYKDIVSLANEAGDQRLVYKFMSLAANTTTWSTRSAFGRYGLSNLLSNAEVDSKLYPKLYRYRFDPNQNVQLSMEQIWKAVAKNPSVIVNNHFDAIIQDLLESILSNEWRVREASCLAIVDILQGQSCKKFEMYYQNIWKRAMRVLDDVKGSVRESALKLCLALSHELVRQLEGSDQPEASKAMMQEVLPFLLSENGVESSVPEAQSFSIQTLLEIVKHGGANLCPFLSDIVPQLLILLSIVEPEQINYHYQRAGKDTRDQIDGLRSQMVSQSPVLEAIENCLRFISSKEMALLAPALMTTIKSALGLPSKLGCSRVLTSLSTLHAFDFKPFIGHFLPVIKQQVLDENDRVSQAYAQTMAYLFRHVSNDVQQGLLRWIVDEFIGFEETNRRRKTTDVLLALTENSPDHLSAYEVDFLPLSYLGSHDDVIKVREGHLKVWAQHAGGSRAVLRYLLEILSLVQQSLSSAQWAMRRIGAMTVAAVVVDISRISDSSNATLDSVLEAIWTPLQTALELKIFPGKENLLDSFCKFIELSPSLWLHDAKIGHKMKGIIIREAQRKNESYRGHAFRSLWKFAKARKDLNMMQDIVNTVTPSLDYFRLDDRTQTDNARVVKKETLNTMARNGLEAVARGYHPASGNLSIQLQIIERNLRPFLACSKFDDIKREVWYDCVTDLMTDMLEESPFATPNTSLFDESKKALVLLVDSLDLCEAGTGTETQRLSRARALSAMMKVANGNIFGEAGLAEGLRASVVRAMDDERAASVNEQWEEALTNLYAS